MAVPIESLAGRTCLWCGPHRSRHAAGVIVSGLVLAVCLAGCGVADDDLVASQVKTLEGDDVEVTSCETVGEAITTYSEYGAELVEAWRCAVKPRDASASVESCYTVFDLEVGVISRLNCSSIGPGCPPGGRRLRGGNAFLGPIIHPDLVLERERGNNPLHQTVRVDVSHDPNGAPEHCGYLDVQLPADAEDPLQLAGERVEAHGWSEDRYSLSPRLLDR